MEMKLLGKVAEKAMPIVKPALFQLKKHLPEILVGTGIASVAGGTVLACKATLEARDILDEPCEALVHVGDEEGGLTEVHDQDAERELAMKRGLKVAVGYLPAAGLLVGGVSMMVAAKSIEHRRFTAMLGAYTSLQTVFEEYRARVVEDGGEELDKRYYNGAVTEKVDILEEQEGKKKPKKTTEEVTVFTAGENPYHRIFDAFNSPLEWQDNLSANQYFLECQQAVLNMELKRNGRIFLNDVYKRLGFDYCEVGQFVGWLADDVEGSKDGYIDFGIDYAAIKREISYAQAEGRRPDPCIWLTFNCDGEIWDKPLNKKREDI